MPILTPSKQQQEILDWWIEHRPGDNLMIEALAGTGKSSVLRMLLPLMTDLQVFVGAYNKSIEVEFNALAAKMNLSRPGLDIKTMHAVGLAAFKYGGGSKTTRVDANKVRCLIDELGGKYSQYGRFISKLVSVAKLSGVKILTPNDDDIWLELVDFYGVDSLLPNKPVFGKDNGDDEKLASELIPYAQKVFDLSLERCEDELDFDDMLLAPLAYKCKFRQYDVVMGDECQDLSTIRQEILCRLLRKDGSMIVVGDSNQCIFGFTGSLTDGMRMLRERMNMAVLPLSVTYRCPKEVVKLANTWVSQLEAHESAPDGIRRAVNLETKPCPRCVGDKPSQECPDCKGLGYVGSSFWHEADGLGPESAILCRVNRPIVQLAYELLRKGIPCQIEGRDFASSLIKLCQKWAVKTLNQLEERLGTYRQKESDKWRAKKDDARAAQIEDKVDTVLCLLDAVRKSGKVHVSDLVDKINAMFGDTENGQRPRVLTLSSTHKCKGREWDKVYILGRSKYMPSPYAKKDWEKDNERNLLYVAVTRAKKELVDIIV